MNERPGGLPERRRHPRIVPKGTVIVHALDRAHRGRLSNLGVGGLLVATSLDAPEQLHACTVEVEIRLDAGRAEWLKAVGRVIRVDSHGIAIAFDDPPAALLAAIDELATASRARARVISVVLIDADEHRRSAMAAGFHATGCTVVEAGTPLEAIVRLGETSFEPDVIAIADSQPTNAADELRTFVERAHPHVKMITIGDDLLEPDGFANWLSSANPDADLPSRVREALVAPRRRRP